MKEAPCLEKGIGAFLFRVVLKLKCIRFSVYRQPSRPPRTSFVLGYAGRAGKARRITRSVQFRSQCQNFCLTGQSTPVSWVERDLFQVMPDPQGYTCPINTGYTNGDGRCQGQVVACELLAGQSLPWLRAQSRKMVRAWGPKRTLTNLYNARPTWLELAHKKLDEAVFAAYGWPSDLSDEEILERLLALNLERAGKG